MIKFLVNQKEHAISDVDPNTTLLEFLREQLHRTGTKEGCATGHCGACTVVTGRANGGVIHYQAINACTTLIGSLHGRQLITVEDLQSSHGLHPVQKAIVECHGSQCGFCTPGMAMSLFAHSRNHQKPDRKSIVEALEGNLCRCTGYRPIIDAAVKMFSTPGRDELLDSAAATIRKMDRITQGDEPVELHANGKSYFAPSSIELLASKFLEYPNARLVAGGTDLCLEMGQSQREFDILVSVERVRELGGISLAGDVLEIGAAVTYSRAKEKLIALYPSLGELIARLGSLQVRNAGTLAGNLANASATGDMATVLLALKASLRLRRGSEIRTISVEDFLLANRTTALRPSEFIERIMVPVSKPGQLFRVYKISKRPAVDISSICGAFSLYLNRNVVTSAVVAFAGMADIPKRAPRCEQALSGLELAESTIESAAQSLAIDFVPISDVRSSAEYRLDTAKNLLRRLYLEFQSPTRPSRINLHG